MAGYDRNQGTGKKNSGFGAKRDGMAKRDGRQQSVGKPGAERASAGRTSAERTSAGRTSSGKSGVGKKNTDRFVASKQGAGRTESGRQGAGKSESGRQESGMGRPGAGRPATGAPKKKSLCPASRKCGGCQYLDMPYPEQLKLKQTEMQKLLSKFCKVYEIKGMKDPLHYRNKVHAVFGYRKGEAISGVYEAGTHNLIPVETCMIEDQKADEIIGTIRGMLKSFKIRTYDEDSGYGLLRHVLIRRGFTTGQIMVVLVTASPVFPSRNNFVKALREKHPEITTIVQNLNDRETSMILGDKEHVLFGKGYIEDELCGCRFRISPKSFYQINPVQTEHLYGKAIELAGLTGKETVLDAYCGIGTIGIIASRHAKQVIGVELNQDAVRDAIQNAKCNDISNIRFFCNDATKFMMQMAESGDSVDVVLMDPPRSGSTEEFIGAVAAVKAKRVIYVSCGPDTLARDLEVFKKVGYQAEGAWPFDLFPQTAHTEVCVNLERKEK